MRQGWDTAGTGVSTGISDGIKGLISEGGSRGPGLLEDRLNTKRKSRDCLCVLSLNGGNAADVKVIVTHWFDTLSIRFHQTKLSVLLLPCCGHLCVFYCAVTRNKKIIHHHQVFGSQ